MRQLTPDAYAIIDGVHSDPFRYLGCHIENGDTVVRAFLPDATDVRVLIKDEAPIQLDRIHDSGLFEGTLPKPTDDYRLGARYGEETIEFDDAYRFPPILSDLDLYLLAEGTHLKLYEKLGAHPMTMMGVEGVGFVVFAPSARRVSVVGDFNYWDGRRHAARVRRNGYWEIFVPGARAGHLYKYEIIAQDGSRLPLKSDPVAFAAELRPSTASVVAQLDDLPPLVPLRDGVNTLDRPMSIYEMHLGSWRRDDSNRWLTYLELAEQLPAYLEDMGFTHVEFLPVSEHPFDGSWGYQPTGLFAPTSRFGRPADFVQLVNALHDKGIGIFMDWVPGHFPDDPHGLARFDGSALYEHANPLQGRHPDWGTLIYNYGRTEVTNFLIANALFWLDRYGLDGLRVDAVASMLYLDYSRPQGGWIPNPHGGRENLEAISFLRRMNADVFRQFPQATTAAEESTAWPQVSRPIEWGGLGFGYKWNMGWMHDTLDYIGRDPLHRRHHHDQILFGFHYAFSENFILPLSHDEVVHGKRSILGRMPGDDWQRFANLRAYYAFMFAHPGKKLLFMGCEFGQQAEWNHEQSLDWHLLSDAKHQGVQSLIRDLNRLYRDVPALHQLDCDAAGFEWLVTDDRDRSVFAFLRRGNEPRDICLVVLNFTPQVHRNYRIKVPYFGRWREILNSDATVYGGSNIGNGGALETSGDLVPELSLTLPPLAAIYLVPENS